MTLEERIAELEAENTALREQIALLATQAQDLHARLAKDSHNSSKAPSSDGRMRKTRSLRRQVQELPPVRLVVTEHQALLGALQAVFSGRPEYPVCA